MSSDPEAEILDEVASDADKGAVKRELNRVEGFLRELSLNDLRQGDWFAKLLTFSLGKYVREVDAAYFTAKYPGLPADAVVQARIQMAARYAGVEGGLSAGAYTGAVVATIGSGGGASPLTLPAAGASFAVDLVYTSQLQLRLAYDIAVLYRVPLDLDDPEDLWKLIRVAFAIRGSEAGQVAMAKGVPVLVRPLVKKVFTGGTLTAAKSLPVVGKYLLQRNVIKFSIPLIGIPLSVAVNYWSTRMIGTQATKIFRDEASIVEAARRMTARTEHHEALLWVLWLIIKADGPVHENERLLLHHVTTILADLDSELPALEDLRSTVDLDHDRVWRLVTAAPGDRKALYDAGVVAAAVDGKIDDRELVELQKLAVHCGTTFDTAAIKRAAKRKS